MRPLVSYIPPGFMHVLGLWLVPHPPSTAIQRCMDKGLWLVPHPPPLLCSAAWIRVFGLFHILHQLLYSAAWIRVFGCLPLVVHQLFISASSPVPGNGRSPCLHRHSQLHSRKARLTTSPIILGVTVGKTISNFSSSRPPRRCSLWAS